MKVFVAKLHMGTHEHIYHTERDCPQLNRSDTIRQKEKSVLSSDMRECEVCKESDQRHGTQHSKVCPFCKTKVGKLPPHLIKCEEK